MQPASVFYMTDILISEIFLCNGFRGPLHKSTELSKSYIVFLFNEQQHYVKIIKFLQC